MICKMNVYARDMCVLLHNTLHKQIDILPLFLYFANSKLLFGETEF